jgi:ubiquitin C-terminal hydrolase
VSLLWPERDSQATVMIQRRSVGRILAEEAGGYAVVQWIDPASLPRDVQLARKGRSTFSGSGKRRMLLREKLARGSVVLLVPPRVEPAAPPPRENGTSGPQMTSASTRGRAGSVSLGSSVRLDIPSKSVWGGVTKDLLVEAGEFVSPGDIWPAFRSDNGGIGCQWPCHLGGGAMVCLPLWEAAGRMPVVEDVEARLSSIAHGTLPSATPTPPVAHPVEGASRAPAPADVSVSAAEGTRPVPRSTRSSVSATEGTRPTPPSWQAMGKASLQRECVGRHVKRRSSLVGEWINVFWPADDRWYVGQVAAFSDHSKVSVSGLQLRSVAKAVCVQKHHVVFTDGDSRWYALHTKEWYPLLPLREQAVGGRVLINLRSAKHWGVFDVTGFHPEDSTHEFLRFDPEAHEGVPRENFCASLHTLDHRWVANPVKFPPGGSAAGLHGRRIWLHTARDVLRPGTLLRPTPLGVLVAQGRNGLDDRAFDKDDDLSSLGRGDPLVQPWIDGTAGDCYITVSLDQGGSLAVPLSTLQFVWKEEDAMMTALAPYYDDSPPYPAIPGKELPERLYLTDFAPIAHPSGLENLGNSCYLNAVLQALAHSMPLTLYVVSKAFPYHINATNSEGTRGRLAMAYSALCHTVWSGHTLMTSPSGVKAALTMRDSMFDGIEQHDAHELLVSFLDALHEDLSVPDHRASLLAATDAANSSPATSRRELPPLSLPDDATPRREDTASPGRVFEPATTPRRPRGDSTPAVASPASILPFEPTPARETPRRFLDMPSHTTSVVKKTMFLNTVARTACCNCGFCDVRPGPRGGEMLPPLSLDATSEDKVPRAMLQAVATGIRIASKAKSVPSHSSLVDRTKPKTSPRTDGATAVTALLLHSPPLHGEDEATWRTRRLEAAKEWLKEQSAATPGWAERKRPIPLVQCLAQYFSPTVMEGRRCPRCSMSGVTLDRHCLIFPLAPIVVIVLKRFSFASGGVCVKRTDPVAFPVRGLDLAPFAEPGPRPHAAIPYDLFALVMHLGRADSGHYVTVACPSSVASRADLGSSKWVMFDDTVVETLKNESFFRSDRAREDAYMLFYVRRRQSLAASAVATE